MLNLRWYQAGAIQSLFDYFGQNKVGNPVVALPTGTGKSVVIAGFAANVLKLWPNQRFIVSVHVKELVSQNAKALLRAWPSAPIGIHSAGLKQRDFVQPLLFGGIASMMNRVEQLGHRDLLIIDEAHLLSPNADTRCVKFIKALKEVNPLLRVIGFTATPYRMGQGLLTDNGIFTDITYDMTNLHAFNQLISEGWIAPLQPKRTKTELDTSNVGIHNGDFSESGLQQAVDVDSVTAAALLEAIEAGADRRCWLAFASGIQHAEHVAEWLNHFGIPAAAVHSKTKNRDEILEAFRAGKLRCVVNNNVLTTGFDFAPIDMIIMLRPTMSPGLWVQMLGRGTRPYNYLDPDQYVPGFNFIKTNCLVLDYAGNTRRLGPINDPVVPRRRGEKTGQAPVKQCPECDSYCHIRAQYCDFCGTEFTFTVRLQMQAASDELIRSEVPHVEWFDINYVTYVHHQPPGKPPMVKVSYYCGLNLFQEYLMFEHDGYPRVKARKWWRERMAHTIYSDPPDKTADALSVIHNATQPKRIRVWLKRKYPEILSHEF